MRVVWALSVALVLGACAKPEHYIQACRGGYKDDEAKAWDCARMYANKSNEYTRGGIAITGMAVAGVAAMAALPLAAGPRTFLICRAISTPVGITATCR